MSRKMPFLWPDIFLLSSLFDRAGMGLSFRPMDSVRCTAWHGCLGFLSQRFSSCGRDEASQF